MAMNSPISTGSKEGGGLTSFSSEPINNNEKRALIVESKKDCLRQMGKIMQNSGYNVTFVSEPAEIAAYRLIHGRSSVIITDNLPFADCATSFFPNSPVAFCGEELDAKRLKETGKITEILTPSCLKVLSKASGPIEIFKKPSAA